MANFGNNSLTESRGTYTMNLFDGGQWSFDGKEIDALDRVLSSFQEESCAIEKRVPRSKSQDDMLVRRVLNIMCLEESGREGHFPASKISALREAIKTEKSKP